MLKTKKSPNSGGVKSGKLSLLNLAHTTTSRPELIQTEKEIMIENKINEIIERLNLINKQ